MGDFNLHGITVPGKTILLYFCSCSRSCSLSLLGYSLKYKWLCLVQRSSVVLD